MKFKMLVKSINSNNEWWENYDRPEATTLEEAQAWAKKTVDSFNATLYPNESARELIKVELMGDSGKKHQWRKQNSVTVRGRDGSLYDVYKCAVCGITGRRYGLSEFIKPDTKYKAKKYLLCKSV